MKEDNEEAKADKKKDRKRKRDQGEEKSKKGRGANNKSKASKAAKSKGGKRQAKAAAKRKANKKGKKGCTSPSKQKLKLLRKAKHLSPSKSPQSSEREENKPPSPVAKIERASSSEGPPDFVQKKDRKRKQNQSKPTKSNAAKQEPPAKKTVAKPEKNNKKKDKKAETDSNFDHYLLCINKVLDECESTSCIHPDAFDGSAPDQFSISCYWTRHAAGVKVNKDRLVPELKQREKKRRQMARIQRRHTSPSRSARLRTLRVGAVSMSISKWLNSLPFGRTLCGKLFIYSNAFL